MSSEGTAEKPVKIGPSAMYPTRGVEISTAGLGRVNLEFSEVANALISGKSDKIASNYFYRNHQDEYIYYSGSSAASMSRNRTPNIPSKGCESVDPEVNFSNNRFRKMSHVSPWMSEDRKYRYYSWGGVQGYDISLFDNSVIYNASTNCTAATNSVFLKNTQTNTNRGDGQRYYLSSARLLPRAPTLRCLSHFSTTGRPMLGFYLQSSIGPLPRIA